MSTIDPAAILPDTQPNTAQPTQAEPTGLANPLVGTLLTWGGAFLLYFTCILLPLVGQAAQDVSHYTLNRITFGFVALLALVVSSLALTSRLQRRKVVDAPFPWIQALLTGAYVFILICLVLGLLKV